MSAPYRITRSLVTICLPILIVGSTAKAEQVVITGGKPKDNVRRFAWKITNNGRKPITGFKALHYASNDAFAPDGWSMVEMTGNVRETLAKPGFVRWEASTPSAAILSGQSLEFQINITGAGRYEAPQTVTVEFSDGTTLDIPGVMCPTKEPFLRQNMAAVGLGAMAVIFVVCHTLWGRRKNKQQETQPQE